jgi:hypothetical protein
MTKLILPFLIIFSCSSKKIAQSKIKEGGQKIAKASELYKVYKIDSINNYYLIYAKRKDSLYKIVSKKQVTSNCANISLNQEYTFSLTSIWNQKIIIEGRNVSPSVTPHVTCLSFDDSTKICLEKDSINDLFHADNVEGLCIKFP